jgi:hypothetical protein
VYEPAQDVASSDTPQIGERSWPSPGRERSGLADAPSFADVLPQWNSRRDLEAAKLGRPVERSGSTPPSSAEKAGDTGVDAVASV